MAALIVFKLRRDLCQVLVARKLQLVLRYCFISLESQVLLDSKEMELVGCDVETEQMAIHNPPTIGP
jgi:hypothetical protein